MTEITQATRARFDKEVAKYPADQRQSAVMACLAIVQQEQGWVSPESEQAVAEPQQRLHVVEGRHQVVAHEDALELAQRFELSGRDAVDGVAPHVELGEAGAWQ